MASSFRKESPFPAQRTHKIAFDQFEADLRAGELRKSGHRIRLQAQPFALLTMLLESAGEVVTRDEACRKLWPGDTFVDFDHGLAAAVNKLREALGDSAEKPRFVETLPKRGYRFIGEVRQAQPVLELIGVETDEKVQKPVMAPPAKPRYATRVPAWSWALLGIAALLAVGFGWAKWRPQSGVPKENLTVVPFTSYPGIETAPSFSPDGSRIAFAWDGGNPAAGTNGPGKYDLYVKAIGSETRMRLTNHPSDWISPAWSPDGTQIAFQRIAGADTGIYAVPALGGPERKLRTTHVPYSLAAALSWSPDGKWIAHDDIVNAQAGDRMFLLSTDTLEDHEFQHDAACAHEGNLTFSHNGEQFAWVCVHSTMSFEVKTSYVKGGPGKSLGIFPAVVAGLAWAADDKSVLVSQSSAAPDALVEVRLNDGKRRDLPLAPAGVWPTLSKAGDKLAFSAATERNNLWRKDLTHPESAALQMVRSSRGQNGAAYSPDGKHIAFDSSRAGVWNVWLSDPDGSNVVRISRDGSGFPQWSPDSQKIAFEMKEGDGPFGIYIADIADQIPRKLKTNVREMTSASWSHDGKWIYFRGYEAVGHKLYRCPSEGGDATELTAEGDATVPQESYDGNALYFLERTVQAKLKMVPVGAKGTTAESVVEGMPLVATERQWVVARDGIFFVPADAPRTVSYFDFATRRTRELFRADQELGDGMSVSPDGRYLLFAQLDEINSEIMLVEKFR